MSSLALPARAGTLVTALVALVVLLAACTGEEQAASPESGEFTGQDVRFLRSILAHHEGTLSVAGLADDSDDRVVQSFGAELVPGPSEQVEEIRELLRRAGSTDQETRDPFADAGEGAVTQEDVDSLAQLEGEELDEALLERLESHLQGGIALGEEGIDMGEHPEVRALGERAVVEYQNALRALENLQEDRSGALD